ncbi:MAG TPA: hypothetical protein VLC28_09440, partial [Flavitalea sp.]|nr:hypothetical protein [Flavitalea sp.]
TDKKIILARPANTDSSGNWFTPFIFTSILLVFVGMIQFSKQKWAPAFLRGFDVAFFFILGALGCLILFMWFGTDHVGCSNNFNLLWALPFHLPVAFVLNRKKDFIRKYSLAMAAWYFMLFFAWGLLPQGMNTAFVPIVILAFMRSIARYKKRS